MIKVAKITCEEFQRRNAYGDSLLKMTRRQRYECKGHFDGCAGCRFFIAFEDQDPVRSSVTLSPRLLRSLLRDQIIARNRGGIEVVEDVCSADR